MWELWVLDDTFPRSLGGSNEMDLTSQRALGSWGFISPLLGSVDSVADWNKCRGLWVLDDTFPRSLGGKQRDGFD